MRRTTSLYTVEWQEKGSRKWTLFHCARGLRDARKVMRHGMDVSLGRERFNWRLLRWVRPTELGVRGWWYE